MDTEIAGIAVVARDRRDRKSSYRKVAKECQKRDGGDCGSVKGREWFESK